jgi:hypothetical protein
MTLATLAMGTCRVAPGPAVTPVPPMSAAEPPSAGHETALSRSWLGMAVPAPGVTGPEGAAGPAGGVISSPVVQPARQESAASSAGIPKCHR